VNEKKTSGGKSPTYSPDVVKRKSRKLRQKKRTLNGGGIIARKIEKKCQGISKQAVTQKSHSKGVKRYRDPAPNEMTGEKQTEGCPKIRKPGFRTNRKGEAKGETHNIRASKVTSHEGEVTLDTARTEKASDE